MTEVTRPGWVIQFAVGPRSVTGCGGARSLHALAPGMAKGVTRAEPHPVTLRGPTANCSEQSDYPPLLVDVDRVGGRHLGQPGHRHDVAADHHDELGPRR